MLVLRKVDQTPSWKHCPQISSGCDTENIKNLHYIFFRNTFQWSFFWSQAYSVHLPSAWQMMYQRRPGVKLLFHQNCFSLTCSGENMCHVRLCPFTNIVFEYFSESFWLAYRYCLIKKLWWRKKKYPALNDKVKLVRCI